tara:strand:+ start:1429 stop:2274 length:846 start_codon:yes stop_codon:yes gene_type:complete
MTKIKTLNGFTVFPSSISEIGRVTFSDDVNFFTPNQIECEAYGYTYNSSIGVCEAFTPIINLPTALGNLSNKNNGANNTMGIFSQNLSINGVSNSTLGNNNNCHINGVGNKIDNGINNSTVLGKFGEATSSNSLVLGCNASGDSVGERQNITLMFGTETTNSTVSDSHLNNTTGSFFAIPTDTIIAFQTETVGVRIGGSGAGNPGDFKGFIETGVAINESGTLSIDKSRSTIANTGSTSGWNCDITVSGTNLVQTVKGANNRTVMWATTIRMTQIKTGVAL